MSDLRDNSLATKCGLAGTTHSFLVDGSGKAVAGYVILVMQIVIYGFLCIEGFANLKDDSIPVSIKHAQCVKSMVRVNSTAALQCSAGEVMENLYGVFGGVVASITVGLFMLRDFTSSIDLIRNGARLPGVLLAIQVFLGVIAAGGAIGGGMLTGAMDAFLGSVAVIFVSDFSAKSFEYFDTFQSTQVKYFLTLGSLSIGILAVTLVQTIAAAQSDE